MCRYVCSKLLGLLILASLFSVLTVSPTAAAGNGVQALPARVESAGSFAATQALPSWSVGMFTVDRCSWAGQQHCRWVVTELNFYPDASRVTITFKGRVVSGLTMTMNNPSSKPGHRAYGWGVPTTFAAVNPDWKNNSYWRLYYRK